MTPASFEPTIDYVVAKIPKWNFEKFKESKDELGTQMKSVGEVMAIGRTFKEALFKGLRSLEAVNPLRLEDVSHGGVRAQAGTSKLASLFLRDLRYQSGNATFGDLPALAYRSMVSRSAACR